MENFNNVPSSGTFGSVISVVNQNFALAKEAIDKLAFSKSACMGFYETSSELNDAHPTPTDGDWALVGNSAPFNVYVANNGSWVDSGADYIISMDVDIVNNLTDGGSDKALSAEMGKVLNLTKASAETTSDTIFVMFDGNATAPVISPAAGEYEGEQTITMTADEDCTIYYTTDGSTPTSASNEYTGAITISQSTTIKAIAVDGDGNTSQVITAAYVITVPLYPTQGLVHEWTNFSDTKTIDVSLLNSANDFTVCIATKKQVSQGNYAHSFISVQANSSKYLFLQRSWDSPVNAGVYYSEDSGVYEQLRFVPSDTEKDGMIYIILVKSGTRYELYNSTNKESTTTKQALYRNGNAAIINQTGILTEKMLIYSRALTDGEIAQVVNGMISEVGQ